MYNSDYLAHFGIKGMRWGFRKKRDASIGEHSGSLSRTTSKKSRSDEVKSMSDDELRRRLNRLQMERQYKMLNKGVDISKGAKATASALKIVGKVALKTIAVAGVYGGAAYLGKKYNLGDAGTAKLQRTMEIVKAVVS